jgi:hypothetical protein
MLVRVAVSPEIVVEDPANESLRAPKVSDLREDTKDPASGPQR